MCGFVGATGTTITERRLAQACDLLSHRGPDGTGLFCNPDDRVALGFRRLAIVDLSPSGQQPMVTDDGLIAIVFNGEIYGFRKLREELAGNYQFRTATDTEVLLHGYREWGIEGLLQRVTGMLAFGLWDSQQKKLYLARDRFGKKPLYYTLGDGLRFASTLPALLALMDRTPDIDPIAMDQYLTYMCVPQPRTIFQGIFMLPPAHYAVFDASGLSVRRYWDLSFATKERRSEDEWLDAIDAELRRAVRDRLVSDVPVGALLSGGVDSSLVVSLMAQESQRRVTTVTCGFQDESYNEMPYAAAVARRWNLDHHEVILEPHNADVLPEMVWHYGQPFADPSMLPTYYVAKAAKQHMTVVLNGDGGDELFGGYSRPVVTRAAALYRQMLPTALRSHVAPAALGAVAGVLGRGGIKKKVDMLVQAGRGSARDAFVYDRAFRSFRTLYYTESFLSQLQDHPDQLYHEVWDHADGPDDVDKALYGDLVTYLPDQLLVKMDVSTMAHSLEARSPLLDRPLAQLVARVPSSLKIKGFQTKYLLKRLATRYVPHDVIYRRKKGFTMPTAEWLRGQLRPYLESVLLAPQSLRRGYLQPEAVRGLIREHMSGTSNHSDRLWSLLMLELWFREFVDGSLKRSDPLSHFVHDMIDGRPASV